MVSIEEALKLIHEHVLPLGTQTEPLEQALGCINARRLMATLALPRFDNSAMDGFAVTMSDAGGLVRAPNTLLAGEEASYTVKPKESVRIMTGAVLPEGADAVIPVEQTQNEPEGIRLPQSIRRGANIRRKGEDIAAGDLLVERGEVLDGYALTLLASQGITHIVGYRKPRVAVFATGYELKMHYQHIEPQQIYNSNTPMLLFRAKEFGCDVRFSGAASDTIESIKAHIRTSLESDLIITSGGVSVGEADFTKEAFRELGMETLFEKIDIKPGKPTTLGRIGNTWVLNLPGNPTAAAVNFELFGRTLINRLSGRAAHHIRPIVTEAQHDICPKPGKFTVLLGHFDGEGFSVLERQGPNMVAPLHRANAFIICAPEVTTVAQHRPVHIIPLFANPTAPDPADLLTR